MFIYLLFHSVLHQSAIILENLENLLMMLDVISHCLNLFLIDVSFYFESLRSGNSYDFNTRYGQIHLFFL